LIHYTTFQWVLGVGVTIVVIVAALAILRADYRRIQKYRRDRKQ
jgi:uncharacterized integral membrane protein